MNKLVLSLLLLPLFSCENAPSSDVTLEEPTTKTCERIAYLLDVKEKVGEHYWTDFNQQVLFSPMLYYTEEGLYVIHPNEKLNKRLKSVEYACGKVPVYVGITNRIDTTDFYMHVSYGDEDTSMLEYKNTLGMFSDVNLTEKFIPDVKDTEEWMSMVIHEMFHMYQRSHEEFRKEQIASQEKFDRDTLDYFYKNIDWFKEGIKKENEFSTLR